jgi:hypothetical protein
MNVGKRNTRFLPVGTLSIHLCHWCDCKTKNVEKKGATYKHSVKTLCQTYKELPELLKSDGIKRKHRAGTSLPRMNNKKLPRSHTRK